MNLFRKIGSIFSKMSFRKTGKAAEKIIQPERIKVEPIRDIEDIVKSSKSPYFSPIQTRNQRINTKISSIPPPIGSYTVLQTIGVDAASEPITVTKESRKALEKKELLNDLKNFPADVDGPLEIAKNEVFVEVVSKPVKAKKKKTEAVSVVKAKPKKKSTESLKEIKVEAICETTATAVKDVPVSPVSGVKGKRKSQSSPKTAEVKQEKWEPDNWSEVLENIKSMRANVEAPVDTMGCHKCSDENADEKTQRFHKLVALMLSSQTKDQVTFEAMNRLKESSLTPTSIADMNATQLETLLYPVSFYKNKAKYLKNTSKILVEQYGSDIPNNIKELMKLPGVGPKMAHICMSTAWDIVTGIGVDVHVHRISNRLGWVPQKTKDPEQTRKALESWLPSDRWREVNYLLVGFGQTVCTPTKPKCSECLNIAICPSANLVKRGRPKKEKMVS